MIESILTKIWIAYHFKWIAMLGISFFLVQLVRSWLKNGFDENGELSLQEKIQSGVVIALFSFCFFLILTFLLIRQLLVSFIRPHHISELFTSRFDLM